MQHKAGHWFPDSDTHFEEWTFEIGHLHELIPYITDKRVAIDGGAHVGAWTKIMALHFDEVKSFEPSPDNFACLEKNTEDLPNVQLFNCAIGEENGKGSLHSPVNPGNSGAAWLDEGDDFEIKMLDSFGFECVDFIKLDVEGFEPQAIQGAAITITRDKPVILVEQKEICARFGMHHMEAGRRLVDMGYRLLMKMNNDYVYAHPERMADEV
jgi:FkbM family methyltransferase